MVLRTSAISRVTLYHPYHDTGYRISLVLKMETSHSYQKSVNYTESRIRDSVLDIATGYGLDGPEIESPVATRFPSPVKAQPPIQCVPGPSRG